MPLLVFFSIFAQCVSPGSGFLTPYSFNIKPPSGAQDWTYVEETEKCYLLLSEKRTYIEAKTICQTEENFHSDIASVDQENFNLSSLNIVSDDVSWVNTWIIQQTAIKMNFFCQTDAADVDCGLWGRKNAAGCSYCGIGPEECGGECFWMENTQACVPLEISQFPEAYTVSSDGFAGIRYPWLMGTYVLNQYVMECPLDAGYFLYIHQDNPEQYLAGNGDGWVIGSDRWHFLEASTTNSDPLVASLIAPKDNWGYVSETNTEPLMDDLSISVLPINLLEMEENDEDGYYDHIQIGIDYAKDIEFDSVDYGEALHELEDEDYDMDMVFVERPIHSIGDIDHFEVEYEESKITQDVTEDEEYDIEKSFGFEFEKDMGDHFVKDGDEEEIFDWDVLEEKEDEIEIDENKDEEDASANEEQILFEELLKKTEVTVKKIKKTLNDIEVYSWYCVALSVCLVSVLLMFPLMDFFYFKFKRNGTSKQKLLS